MKIFSLILGRTYSSLPKFDFKLLKVTNIEKVGIVQLNRPQSLNALSRDIFVEINQALSELDRSPYIHAIILTGDEKAFAGEFVL